MLNEITYGIYIGDSADAQNVGQMIRNGIMTVVNLEGGDRPVGPIAGFSSINLRFENISDRAPWQKDIVKWMGQSQKRGGIAVCSKDIREAAVIISMFLLQHEGMSIEGVRQTFRPVYKLYDKEFVESKLSEWGIL